MVRGFGLIGLAGTIVFLSAFGPKLQVLAQNDGIARYFFGAIFAATFLWLLYQNIYSVAEEWRQFQEWNIGGDKPLDSATRFYEIFRLYMTTKRIFMYGSLVGAMAILFGVVGIASAIGPGRIDGSPFSTSVSDIHLWLYPGEVLVGVLSALLSYRIGRQILPAKLLMEKVLWLLLNGNKGNDKTEDIQRTRDNLLSEIEKTHPLWFQ
ncbi:MAG: hypothetical protein WCA81_04140 [Rhizomicrobium sp.]